MTADTSTTPFDGQPPAEIDLPRSPLLRVLAQVRFESMGAFVRPNVVVPFVDQLLHRFPLYEEGHEMQLVLGPNGINQQQEATNKIWRLRTADTNTVVTVSNGSLALETTQYGSRKDFLNLFSEVVAAFNRSIGVSSANRVGVRYTNRIDLSELTVEQLRSFLRLDTQGGIAVRTSDSVSLQHSISDMLFSVDDGSLQARTGILPPNAMLDPTLPASPERTWLLDIDSYSETRRVMDLATLEPAVGTLAERAYSLFRWMVTDQFLRHFGGNV